MPACAGFFVCKLKKMANEPKIAPPKKVVKGAEGEEEEEVDEEAPAWAANDTPKKSKKAKAEPEGIRVPVSKPKGHPKGDQRTPPAKVRPPRPGKPGGRPGSKRQVAAAPAEAEGKEPVVVAKKEKKEPMIVRQAKKVRGGGSNHLDLVLMASYGWRPFGGNRRPRASVLIVSL